MTGFLPEVEVRQASASPAIPLGGIFLADQQEGLCRMLSRKLGSRAGAFPARPIDPPVFVAAHRRMCESPRDTTRPIPRRRCSVSFMRPAMHSTSVACPMPTPGSPSGTQRAWAAHESQSLIVEMQACRSDAFLSWLGPELNETFGGDAAAYTAQNLGKLWRRVERGFIRVDADEVTYPAHVILRFRLERALVAGDLHVGDIPGAWAEQMRALLGVTPPDDRRGCLQDIHWYDGRVWLLPQLHAWGNGRSPAHGCRSRRAAGSGHSAAPWRSCAVDLLVETACAWPG